MNAYNPLASMKRLEQAGPERRHAEAIAAELNERVSDLVTKDQLEAALDRMLIKIGIMTSAIVALACTVGGVLISIK